MKREPRKYACWIESNCVYLMNLSSKLRMNMIIALQFIVMSQDNQIAEEKLTLLTLLSGSKSSEFHCHKHLTQIKWQLSLSVCLQM